MKEKCSNHPERNSLSICHSCGKYFCEDCLDEGDEYYYCKKEKCQLLLNADNKRLKKIKEEIESICAQRWKENSKRFYKKLVIILSVFWLILTVLLFAFVPSYEIQRPYLLPLLSLLGCVILFFSIYFSRVHYYGPIWKLQISQELREKAQI